MFNFDDGEVVSVFIKKGFNSKNHKLILNVVEALYKLLKTDEDFNCEGQNYSVGKKMYDLKAHSELEDLMTQQNETLFEAAQDTYAYY